MKSKAFTFDQPKIERSMASLFKKFKKKLPTVSNKNSAYFNRENAIETLHDLNKILKGAPEIKGMKTDKELTFNNISLLEITPSMLWNTFDNPAHVMDRSDYIPGHKVVFYKENVLHYKFLIQYHFINEKFFFASNKISSISMLSDSDKMKIINRIAMKYFNNEDTKSLASVMKAIDPNGSVIYTVDDVYFHMHYIPANDTREMLMAKYADVPEQTSKPQGFKESLDKYI